MDEGRSDELSAENGRMSEAKVRLKRRRQLALEGIYENESGIFFNGKWQSFSDANAREHYEALDQRAGLALSGGGIRSATLSLGLCEALAAGGRLYGFDMLSTVSGGGYLGSFLRSLHVKRENSKTEEPIADRRAFAYATMASLPDQQYFRGDPGSSRFIKKDAIIKNPLWWLRENGRYLAPRGGADYIYALAYIVRNWLTLMIFITSVAFIAFAGLQTAMLLVQQMIGNVELPALAAWAKAAKLSPLMVLVAPGASILAGVATAYWFSAGWPYFRLLPKSLGVLHWISRWVGVLIAASIVIGIAFAQSRGWIPDDQTARMWAAFLAAVLSAALASALIVVTINSFRLDAPNHVDFRRNQTRLLGVTSTVFAGFLTLVIIDSAALWLRPALTAGMAESGETNLLATGVLSASITSLLSILIAKLPDILAGQQNWLINALRKHATNLALLASLLILFAIGLLADTLAIKLLWKGPAWGSDSKVDWSTFLIVIFVVSLITYLLARSRNFTNLLALTPLYGSRLTRTFVGGSNASRLLASYQSSVTRGHNDDDIAIQRYMEGDFAAPLHLINVTRNRTIGELHGGAPINEDHDDPLVLRSDRHPLGRLASYESNLTLYDRHGDRMVFGPFGMRVGGRFVDWEDIKEPPTLGHLCAISGAAIGAGMGRLSSLGTSMALTLANVRLGHWWREQKSSKASGNDHKGAPRTTAFSVLLPGLACLLKELTGRFGTRNFWFLSDGGHSENTGVLTLLERGCQFILAADNGQDPDFTFGDLEILIRAARTDIGMEMEVVKPEKFPKHLETVREHFLNGQDMNWRENARSRDHSGFALLLRALDIPEKHNGEWSRRENSTAWIIWLKPNCFAHLPADIGGYAQEHTDFPQQTTANQFFDEAQWESYRRLGFEMGSRLFAEQEALDQFHLPIIHQA